MRATHLTLLPLFWLGACQSLPTNVEMLEEARSDYRAANDDPSVRQLAGAEMRRADEAMIEAERSWYRNEGIDQVTHWAYLAKHNVALAQQRHTRQCAELVMLGAGASPSPTRESIVRACERKSTLTP